MASSSSCVLVSPASNENLKIVHFLNNLHGRGLLCIYFLHNSKAQSHRNRKMIPLSRRYTTKGASKLKIEFITTFGFLCCGFCWYFYINKAIKIIFFFVFIEEIVHNTIMYIYHISTTESSENQANSHGILKAL